MTPSWMRGDEWLIRTMSAWGWMSLSMTCSSMRSGSSSSVPLRSSYSPQHMSTRQSSTPDLHSTARHSAARSISQHTVQLSYTAGEGSHCEIKLFKGTNSISWVINYIDDNQMLLSVLSCCVSPFFLSILTLPNMGVNFLVNFWGRLRISIGH